MESAGGDRKKYGLSAFKNVIGRAEELCIDGVHNDRVRRLNDAIQSIERWHRQLMDTIAALPSNATAQHRRSDIDDVAPLPMDQDTEESTIAAAAESTVSRKRTSSEFDGEAARNESDR